MRRAPALVAAAALAAAALAVGPARSAAPDAACDWRAYGHDATHGFAAPDGCAAITPTNVATLVPAWSFATPDSVTASPAVAGDTVYVGDWAGTFYALPTHPGPGGVTPRWTFRVDDSNGVGFGRITSSAAVTDVLGRRVVLFGGGATLYALDAATGAPLAALCLDPRADPAVRCRAAGGPDVEIESSPAVVERGAGRVVVVGMDVHNDEDLGRTGVVAAALRPGGPTGVRLEPMWKFDPEARQAYTGPDLLTRGAGTGSGCAGVWSSPAVDVAAGLVFFGTASCNGDVRNGAESMWAVRLVDGSLVWTYAPPRTTLRYDDDFGASPNLLPGGLVGEGSKDGVYHVRHRATGLPAFAAHVGQSGQAMDDFSVGGMIGSAAVGRVGDEPAVFVTTAIGTPLDLPVGADGGPTPDPTVAQDPGRLLSIHAISARDGRVLWRSPVSRQTYGAASYANGVVFVTSTVGSSVTAYDADTGVALWSGPVVGPSSSTPVVAGDSLYFGAGTQTGQVAGVWAYRLIGG